VEGLVNSAYTETAADASAERISEFLVWEAEWVSDNAASVSSVAESFGWLLYLAGATTLAIVGTRV
jgi:hypothetical protein